MLGFFQGKTVSWDSHPGGSWRVSNHSLPFELNVTITSSSHRISRRKGERHTQTWWRPEDQESVTESSDCLSTLNLPDDEGKDQPLTKCCSTHTLRHNLKEATIIWKEILLIMTENYDRADLWLHEKLLTSLNLIFLNDNKQHDRHRCAMQHSHKALVHPKRPKREEWIFTGAWLV